MPYDRPYAFQPTLSTARFPAEALRPIEPMLLVHQEQVETIRLIAAAIKRGLRRLLSTPGA